LIQTDLQHTYDTCPTATTSSSPSDLPFSILSWTSKAYFPDLIAHEWILDLLDFYVSYKQCLALHELLIPIYPTLRKRISNASMVSSKSYKPNAKWCNSDKTISGETQKVTYEGFNEPRLASGRRKLVSLAGSSSVANYGGPKASTINSGCSLLVFWSYTWYAVHPFKPISILILLFRYSYRENFQNHTFQL
jgi:hypothetical protein